MATGLATTDVTRIHAPVEMPRSEAIERALINGDLSGLSPRERWHYYAMRCEAAGLDPRSQPFQYLNLNNKLVLYATKATTDQLIANRHLSVAVTGRGFEADTGLYEVQVRVSFPAGQYVDDVGAIWISKGEIGEKLANAVMKCVTKAKRRTVLSACGLGMLDESEIDSIQGAVRVEAKVNSSGLPLTIEPPIGTPAAITPAAAHQPAGEPRAVETSEVNAWIKQQVQAVNDHVHATLVIEQKGDRFKSVVENLAQVKQALVTKWIADGVMEEAEVQATNKKGELVRDPKKVGAAVAVGWDQDREELKSDVRAYLDRKVEEVLREAGVEVADDGDKPSTVNAETT